MAQFHFIEDYERLVARHVETYPIDEAMSLVVGGGSYEIFGQMEAEIVQAAGLRDGMRLVDLGCGSGRLASALHRGLSIPQETGSADMVSAFSLFTHLLQAESHAYLEEAARILKPGGKVVFSFLEFAEATHWNIFEQRKANARAGSGDHLNVHGAQRHRHLGRKTLSEDPFPTARAKGIPGRRRWCGKDRLPGFGRD